jgi:hypothetical protein
MYFDITVYFCSTYYKSMYYLFLLSDVRTNQICQWPWAQGTCHHSTEFHAKVRNVSTNRKKGIKIQKRIMLTLTVSKNNAILKAFEVQGLRLNYSVSKQRENFKKIWISAGPSPNLDRPTYSTNTLLAHFNVKSISLWNLYILFV